jgi:hypothetical protein
MQPQRLTPETPPPDCICGSARERPTAESAYRSGSRARMSPVCMLSLLCAICAILSTRAYLGPGRTYSPSRPIFCASSISKRAMLLSSGTSNEPEKPQRSTVSRQLLYGLAAVPLALFSPFAAHASSAHESLRLLDGYQSRIPDSVVWVTLIVIWGSVQYKISRFTASL